MTSTNLFANHPTHQCSPANWVTDLTNNTWGKIHHANIAQGWASYEADKVKWLCVNLERWVLCRYDSSNVIDCHKLYNVGNTMVPFEKEILLVGIGKGFIGVKAIFDDGAMVNVIDTEIFNSIKDLISPWGRSSKVHQMASGILIPLGGTWTGTIVVRGARAKGSFEIFPSHGAWEALFGKPLLREFSASREYVRDTITLNIGDQQLVIWNSLPSRTWNMAEELWEPEVAIAPISNLGDHTGDPPLRLRQVNGIESTWTTKQVSYISTDLEPVRIATTNLNSRLKTIKTDIFPYGVGQHGRRRADHRRRREKKRQTKSRTKGSSLINNWEQNSSKW